MINDFETQTPNQARRTFTSITAVFAFIGSLSTGSGEITFNLFSTTVSYSELALFLLGLFLVTISGLSFIASQNCVEIADTNNPSQFVWLADKRRINFSYSQDLVSYRNYIRQFFNLLSEYPDNFHYTKGNKQFVRLRKKSTLNRVSRSTEISNLCNNLKSNELVFINYSKLMDAFFIQFNDTRFSIAYKRPQIDDAALSRDISIIKKEIPKLPKIEARVLNRSYLAKNFLRIVGYYVVPLTSLLLFCLAWKSSFIEFIKQIP